MRDLEGARVNGRANVPAGHLAVIAAVIAAWTDPGEDLEPRQIRRVERWPASSPWRWGRRP